MSKRTFKLDSGLDFSITLEIDTNILTPQFAHDMACFWSSHKEVRDAANGDDYEAVARYAAPRLWLYMMYDGYHEEGAVATLKEQDGWLSEGDWIRVVDHDVPDLDPAYLEVEEAANGQE